MLMMLVGMRHYLGIEGLVIYFSRPNLSLCLSFQILSSFLIFSETVVTSMISALDGAKVQGCG